MFSSDGKSERFGCNTIASTSAFRSRTGSDSAAMIYKLVFASAARGRWTSQPYGRGFERDGPYDRTAGAEALQLHAVALRYRHVRQHNVTDGPDVRVRRSREMACLRREEVVVTVLCSPLAAVIEQ